MSKIKTVYVSTHPFSESKAPLELLNENGIKARLNSFGRKIQTKDLAESIQNADALIAGTEKIDRSVLENAPNLKLISRVGIGLDGIDFDLCKEFGVKVTYTPDAPTLAVAELTLALMLDLLRQITVTYQIITNGKWHRFMGNLLYGKTVGLVGFGRIGKSVAHLLRGFNVKLLVHDINPDLAIGNLYNVMFVSKDKLLRESDIVSLHIPLKKDTYNYITSNEFELMKPHSIIINTARGNIVNESDLYTALKNRTIRSSAVDVFSEEPYRGNLTTLDNCLLTCHMGASTLESRSKMEIEAVEEIIRFTNGEQLKNEVFAND